MARTWNGSAGFDETVVLSPGALTGLDGGPITVAAIWCPQETHFGTLIMGRSSGSAVWSLIALTDNRFYVEGDFTGFDGYVNGAWQLIAYTKATGSATVRWHSYRYDTATWTHADGSTVGDGSGAIDEVWLGTGHGRLDGSMEALGVWGSVLTDAQVEDLAFSWQAWQAYNPAAAWLFDQDATTTKILDWTGGGANEASITGSSPVPSTLSAPIFSLGHQSVVPLISATQDATVAPATVAGVTTVGSPSMSTGETVSPATVAGVTSVGSVAVSTGSTVSPATVAGTASVGAPQVSTGSRVSPSTVAGVTTIGSAAAAGGATVSPATVAGVATIGAPSITGSASVTITPATVAATTTIGVVHITAQSAPQAGGGWWTLLTYYREAADEIRMQKSRPPRACPDCGEPLRQGKNNELYCVFDGWSYPRDGHGFG